MKLFFWPRRSTRAFIRAAWRLPGYSFFDWLHGYVYARWPYLYISIGAGEHPLARRAKPIIGWIDRAITRRAQPTPPAPLPPREGGDALPSPRRGGVGGGVPPRGGVGGEVTFADTYHGKVVTLEAATKLVRVDRAVALGDLEQIIPYALARDIVLQHPDHIVAMDCPCRAARQHPCTPLDVCLIVGEPFAGFIAEHQPRRSRWITADEAAAILQAEHERGHVHHAFFKDAMLGRFYAICNCCTCCCGAMQAQRNGVPILAASGYVCRNDPERCIGCGTCIDRCPFDALALDGGQAVVDFDKCMGCGVCVDQCPLGGLALVRDERKGLPLEMDALLAAATVTS